MVEASYPKAKIETPGQSHTGTVKVQISSRCSAPHLLRVPYSTEYPSQDKPTDDAGSRPQRGNGSSRSKQQIRIGELLAATPLK